MSPQPLPPCTRKPGSPPLCSQMKAFIRSHLSSVTSPCPLQLSYPFELYYPKFRALSSMLHTQNSTATTTPLYPVDSQIQIPLPQTLPTPKLNFQV